jgi:hypothetical protein
MGNNKNHYDLASDPDKMAGWLAQEDICRQFGCGNTLSMQEKLFGNYCSEHSIRPPQASINIDRLITGKTIGFFPRTKTKSKAGAGGNGKPRHRSSGV